MGTSALATHEFSSGGPEVSVVGLGGEGVLRTTGRQVQAREVIGAAVDAGITYFDSARVYADSERYYGSVWQAHPGARERVFQASKSACRDRSGAMADLDQSLQRLQTNYLDLWQIHDVRTEQDLQAIAAPGGALEAFVEARRSGKVRYIGVTGHHDPGILTRAVEQWPLDAVMMPVNPVEGVLGGFLTNTLPAARAKGLAVIAMKVLGASHYVHLKSGLTADLLIRYALSHPITVAIVGCSSAEEVAVLARAGQRPEPLSDTQKTEIHTIFEPYARRLAYYRGVL